MAKHKKHEDIVDVQVRTRILDVYGNPIPGAIEYDPSTGKGKRIALGSNPIDGLIEPFEHKDGSIEIDGHNFDNTNQDQSVIDSIKDMITLKVNRNTPEYDDLLKQHINQKRQDDIATHPSGQHHDKPTPPDPSELTFIAKTQIARGEQVKIDMDKLEVRGTRSDNVNKPLQEAEQDKIRDRPQPHASPTPTA